MNLTLKRNLETPITVKFEDDFVVNINGDGLDAELMGEYYAAFDENAYTVSHVGWGMSSSARWESLAMFEKEQMNGTELPAFAGNFLLSTGANEFAGRFTRSHFDLPLGNCGIWLAEWQVIENGVLLPPLAFT